MARFGSLTNLMASNSKSAEPEVGMGATILMYSDRHAATIVEVNASKTRVGIQRDDAKRVDDNGMSDSQHYEFTPDTSAPVEYYTLRKNGKWVRVGQPQSSGAQIGVGYRSEYYDFTF